MTLNFAITGVAGYVAPRHLKAIRDTGNHLVAATDPHDSVGVLDGYFLNVSYFREIERFERHLEKLHLGPCENHIHYISICSPNFLHDAHIRLALRTGANAICEKPLVINPWNLDLLQRVEEETGRRVYTVLQLRLHPSLMALRDDLLAEPTRKHRVVLTYVTGRGPWYDYSWKGSAERSGGLAMNIGIHLFDLLMWLFGPVQTVEIHRREPRKTAGRIVFERAEAIWYLSLDVADLPNPPAAGGKTTFRSITVDGRELEFSEGFGELHTRVYEETLAGRGFGIAEARPSIELVHRIRHEPVLIGAGERHPYVLR